MQAQSSGVATHFSGGQKPMDISVVKGKGKHNGSEGKGKYNKGKGKGNNGKGYANNNGYNIGKGKGKPQHPIGYHQPFKGTGKTYHSNNKERGSKGQKQAPNTRAKASSQPGHMAKDCRGPVYNITGGDNEQALQGDAVDQWYAQQQSYDGYWWNNDQTYAHGSQQQPVQPVRQLALPPAAPSEHTPSIQIVSTAWQKMSKQQSVPGIQATGQQNRSAEQVDLMIDSGAATHVCPTWFADNYPLFGQQPQLRTAANDAIKVHGYKWAYIRTATDIQS